MLFFRNDHNVYFGKTVAARASGQATKLRPADAKNFNHEGTKNTKHFTKSCRLSCFSSCFLGVLRAFVVKFLAPAGTDARFGAILRQLTKKKQKISTSLFA